MYDLTIECFDVELKLAGKLVLSSDDESELLSL